MRKNNEQISSSYAPFILFPCAESRRTAHALYAGRCAPPSGQRSIPIGYCSTAVDRWLARSRSPTIIRLACGGGEGFQLSSYK